MHKKPREEKREMKRGSCVPLVAGVGGDTVNKKAKKINSVLSLWADFG